MKHAHFTIKYVDSHTNMSSVARACLQGAVLIHVQAEVALLMVLTGDKFPALQDRKRYFFESRIHLPSSGQVAYSRFKMAAPKFA